ncbi:protease FtsH-inhibitory lysogeny factor CIII [Salmonella enterica]|nr:protease FtsH-inhibitory lysogeny factor CIII [Salmonella enterica]
MNVSLTSFGRPVIIAHLNESLLERITRKLRAGWKRLVDILNQPGVPCNG